MRAGGGKEYHCPTCGKLLVVGSFVGWVQAHCKKCKRERRFHVE